MIDDDFDIGFAGFASMLTYYSVHIQKLEWITDSRASVYMCGEPTVVNNAVNLKNELKINMPNGDTSNIVSCGNVAFINGLHLRQV